MSFQGRVNVAPSEQRAVHSQPGAELMDRRSWKPLFLRVDDSHGGGWGDLNLGLLAESSGAQ